MGCRFTGTGSEYPATRVDVSTDQDVTIDIDLFDGADCQAPVGMACSGGLFLPAGSWIVYCPNPKFDGLPAGTQYSVIWTYQGCDPSACINHTVGSDPVDCQM
jgi:hypothetical protein